MSCKRGIAIMVVGLSVMAARAEKPARQVSVTPVALEEPLEIDEVAAVSTAKMMTYQGLAQKSGTPISNQSMVVEFRAYTALAGGTQMGTTVEQTLLPSAVQDGIFTAQFDAAQLALPENADETYLEVAICSPAPCTAVPLAPRSLVTHSALAMSARSVGGVARPDAEGALVVESSAGIDAGTLKAKGDLGGGVFQEMQLAAKDGAISAARSDATAAAMTIEALAPNGDKTVVQISEVAQAIDFYRVEAVAQAAGPLTPPPKFRVNLAGDYPSISASSGTDPAAIDFNYGTQAAMQIGEDPEAIGEAVMMLGPKGVLLSDQALNAAGNVAAPANYWRLFVNPSVLENTAEGGVAAPGPKFQIQSVSNNIPTTYMQVDRDTGETVFSSAAGVRSDRFKIGGAALSNVATGSGSAELSVNKNGNVELKVNDEVVDRWTEVGSTPSGAAPNRISGSEHNYVVNPFYGCGILSGGGPPSETNPTWDQDNGFPPDDLCSHPGEPCIENANYCTYHLCTIAGGLQNHAGLFGFVGGGDSNFATGNHAVIGGGAGNRVSGHQACVVGGADNQASGRMSTMGGGLSNRAPGDLGSVLGGYYNEAGGRATFAGGKRAVARGGDDGTFVWADAQGLPADPFTNPVTTNGLYSSGPNQFVVRAGGGLWFGTAATQDMSDPNRTNAIIPAGHFIETSTGAYLSDTGIWTDSSDRDKKENFQPLDGLDVLERLADLTVTRWNFKDGDAAIQHIGPVAQDFHAAFGVGPDDKHIAPLDTAGVALAAIQSLYQIVQDKDCEIAELREKTERLEAMFNALASQNTGGTP